MLTRAQLSIPRLLRGSGQLAATKMHLFGHRLRSGRLALGNRIREELTCVDQAAVEYRKDTLPTRTAELLPINN